MQNYSFEDIREEVLIWYQACVSAGAKFMELTRNEDKIVIIDLSFDSCLAQIVVSNETFTPYNKVSFEAATIDSQMAIESGKPEMIYFFYDSEDTEIERIIDGLNAGVEYCLKFIPDCLVKQYKNKKGTISIGSEKISTIIHPDDLKKAEKINYNAEYICIDVQYQYLVITNNVLTIRVLPQFFKYK